MNKTLDINEKQEVQYCIPLWLRDEQIQRAIKRPEVGRILGHELRGEPIACVSFGPSLNDTWEELRNFKFIMSCSGAHKFLIDRGITPTWHVEVDPREHKVGLMGEPRKDVEYLIASTCHPKLFDHLSGFRVLLWHVFANKEDELRLLPHGDWAVTGGCSVGLRTLTLARFLGFTDLHIFGMDGCAGKSGSHSSEHPNGPKKFATTNYNGVEYETTISMLEAARQTSHELNQLKDCTAKFYGEGLVQAMMRDYVRKPMKGSDIALAKPELISAEYRSLNSQLHEINLAYGVGGGKHADTVQKLAAGFKTQPSILDYGCGKGYLAKALPFPIWEYDPAIHEKSESPRPADLVVCTDVLEHIEPEKLLFVLDDLRRCVKAVGFFVIHTGPARKTLPDGRNTHLIQRDKAWWKAKLSKFFTVGQMTLVGPELYTVVGPKKKAVAA